MSEKKIKRTTIDLKREQLFAILLETDGGPVEIERTQGSYKHTYARDETLKAEGRVLHVAKNGKVTNCEGTFL